MQNTDTQQEIKQLPEVVKPLNGVGIPGLSAKLVERTQTKAWYLREDGVHEVFKIKIEKGREMRGKWYPAHEKYPGNEDFGRWAWCFSGKNAEGNAKKIFARIG